MKPEDLKSKLKSLGFDTIRERAIAMNTPIGTYYKWETGKRRVPGIVEVAIRAIKKDGAK